MTQARHYQLPESARAPATRVSGARDDRDLLLRSLLLVGAFLSGWNLLRVGSMNVTFADIALMLGLGVIVSRGKLNLLPFGAATVYWVAALTLMLGGLFVSSLINGDPLRWANVAIQYTMAYLLIPMLLMSQERRLTQMLPVAFVLGTTLSEAIGITATFFFTMHDTIGLLGDGFITGNQRLGALAGQPNPNGAVIAFSLPMLIFSVVKGTMPRSVGLICGLILLWGLMLSASFTGFFASTVAIGVTLALIGLRHVIRLGLALAVAVGLFFASGAPLPKAFQQRVGGAVETGDISQAGTFLNRSELIVEAWGFAENTALIGMGVDRYRELSSHDNPVHNLYLLIWNEGGAVAFIGLIGLLAMLCVLAASGLRRSREEGAMACAIVIVLLIYTASYPHMYSRMWVVPVFIALGIIYGPRGNEPAVSAAARAAADPRPLPPTRRAPQA